MGSKTFDAKCYELAEYFCDDAGIESRIVTEELAKVIQEAAEDFIASEGKPDEPEV